MPRSSVSILNKIFREDFAERTESDLFKSRDVLEMTLG